LTNTNANPAEFVPVIENVKEVLNEATEEEDRSGILSPYTTFPQLLCWISWPLVEAWLLSNTDVEDELMDASPIRSRLSPDAKGSKEKLAFWTLLLEHVMGGAMVVRS
jgi:hypothetical protein